MSGAANCPETPRQKMIGMMYLVLTAMLALNVSADILNGFILVNNSLKNTLSAATMRNASLYAELEARNAENPAKVGEWLDKANEIRTASDNVFNLIEEIKVAIIKVADGKESKGDTLINASNLDAAGQIGLVEKRGEELQKALTSYSELLQSMVSNDPKRQEQYAKIFNTDPRKTKAGVQTWPVQVFESMPAAATTTILGKFQNDVRNSESEVVQYLIGQTDAGDYRVNEIKAVVIPTSKNVFSGGKYSAQIILAAQDTTKKPIITVNDKVIENGLLEFPVNTIGQFTFKGKIELPSSNPGEMSRFYDFESDYMVSAPAVIISADLMNVFYAGIDNPVSISIPGIPSSAISATMTNGTLQRTSKGWVAKPARVGIDCNITVIADVDGKKQSFPGKAFRVKPLPPPVAFVPYKDKDGNVQKYKGLGKAIQKRAMLDAPGVAAELDDADLDVKYQVLSFEVHIIGTMGTIVEMSNGNRFSDRQKAAIDRLARGAKFFILNTKAEGPDKIVRTLPAIDVTLN